MSQDKHDQELDNYLQGGSDLSQAYQRAAQEQPPSHLDDAILAAARRAVKSRPRSGYSPFPSDWHRPVAIAAVVMMCVGIVIHMHREVDESPLKPPQMPQPEQLVETNREFADALPAEAPEAEARDFDTKEQAVMPQRVLMREMPARPAPQAAMPPPPPSPATESFSSEALSIQADTEAEVAEGMLSETGKEIIEIKKIWEAGDKENAIQRLQSLLDHHPQITIESLRHTLDPALLESVTTTQ